MERIELIQRASKTPGRVRHHPLGDLRAAVGRLRVERLEAAGAPRLRELDDAQLGLELAQCHVRTRSLAQS